MFDESSHCAPAVTTITGSECAKCGTITKSGKSSCCGRGGSWFGKCGGVGNARFGHTWVEGIQVCKSRSQSKIHIAQRNSIAHQKLNDSASNDAGMVNSKSAIRTATTFKLITFNTSRSRTAQIITSVNTPINTSTAERGYAKLLKTFIHISLLLISILF